MRHPRSVENVYNHHMFPGKAGIMQRDVTRAALAVVLPFLSRIFFYSGFICRRTADRETILFLFRGLKKPSSCFSTFGL